MRRLPRSPRFRVRVPIVVHADATSGRGGFRVDQLLNETAFHSLAHARALIAEWREDYNRSRPHTSLGGLTPAEFRARAEQAQNQNGLSL